jgi:hypothetical protein
MANRKYHLELETLEDRQMLSAAPMTPDIIFHSNPGAKATVYLDFQGYTQPTNASFNPGVRVAPYSLDGDTSTFSADEKVAIKEMWQRVAEAYSPFDVDVTTEAPTGPADGHYVRAVIGAVSLNDGGEAWRGGFNDGDESNNTVMINVKPLSSANYWYWQQFAPQNAVTISHEVGHAFGLDHQWQYDGAGKMVDEAAGIPGKAPIMGNFLYAFHGNGDLPSRTTWWSGPNGGGPSSQQDDASVIASAVGYRAHTGGASSDTAASLTPQAGTNTATASGVITTTGDKDYYAFDTAGGEVTIKVGVAHTALEGGYANMAAATLDARLELYQVTDSGQLIPVSINGDPSDSLEVNVTANLSAGHYVLVVASHGDAGDIGQYTLSVSAPAAATTDGNSDPNTDGGVTLVAVDFAFAVTGAPATSTAGSDSTTIVPATQQIALVGTAAPSLGKLNSQAGTPGVAAYWAEANAPLNADLLQLA